MSENPVPSAVSAEEINTYLRSLEMSTGPGVGAIVDHVEQDFARCRHVFTGEGTRPGGFIPGPTQMQLVDLAVWVAVFTRAGIAPMAVTWELKINFLRPALGGDLIADARLQKYGKFSFAVVDLFIAGAPERIVSSASATYAVPDEVLERTRPA